MRAKELWRLTPRVHTTREPERAAAVPPESAPAELQAKMVAAFERARAERPAARPDDGARPPGDPRISANAAAFLVLERERLAVAARLSHPYRRRGDRYRDLILVTDLMRVEYEHLAGRAGEAAGTQSPTNGLGGVGDMPADWARPWGAGPMVEMGTAFAIYRNQRDRLARWLPTASRDGAAVAANAQLERIMSRFESAKGGRNLWLEPLSESASQRTWPVGSVRFPRRAAAVAVAVVAVGAVGVGGILAATRSGEPVDAVTAPSRAVVAVPAAMAAVNERPHRPPPARGAGDDSKALERKAKEGQVDQTTLATSETPPRHPRPVPDVAPAPAPASTTTPPAPAAAPQPDPSPQPDPKPGPVSSLPPPVDSLPDPGDSGTGGG